MGSGASSKGSEGSETSVDDIKAALTGLKEGDINKLQEAVESLADEDFQKLLEVVCPGMKVKSDADAEYVKSTGLVDVLNGLARCALTMKPLDLNKFGIDYFSGELEKQKRLVLISSNAGDVEQLKSCVRDRGDMGAPIVTAVYEYGGTPEDLTNQIKDLCTDGPFKTVALCCHGGADEIKEDTEGFKWQLLEKCGVQIGAGGESDTGAEDILQALADATSVRLDLLACDLVASKVGLEWINEWEKKIGKNVAASLDVTGNADSGGNWVLETDGIDVSEVYFKQDAINEYAATFRRMAGSVAGRSRRATERHRKRAMR